MATYLTLLNLYPELNLGDIDAVEVIGGSCRVPAIKEVIQSVFKRDLSTTLNLDEAVSRGCALQCAMLSPTFKVREFNVTDIQPYPIQLRWQAPLEGEDGSVQWRIEGRGMLNYGRDGHFRASVVLLLSVFFLYFNYDAHSPPGKCWCSKKVIRSFTAKC